MIDVVGAGSGAMLTPPGFGDMPLLAAAAAAEAPVETGSRISVFESLRKGRSLSAEQTVVPSGMPPPGFGGVAPGGGSYSDQAAAGGAPVLGSGGWGSAASQDASFAAAAATLQQYFSRSSSPAVAAFSDQPGFLSSYAPAAAAWPQQPSPSLYDPSSGVPAQLQPAALGGSYLAVPGQYGAAAVAVPGGAAATAAVSAADEPISSKADLELAQKLQVLDDDEAFLRSLGWCEASGSV